MPQTEPNETEEQNSSSCDTDFVPRHQKRRMSEAEQRHRRKIQSFGTAANCKAVPITSDPPHLAALSCPPPAHEMSDVIVGRRSRFLMKKKPL